MRPAARFFGTLALFLFPLAKSAFSGEKHTYSDPGGDLLTDRAAAAYDLVSVEVEKRSSNVIRFILPLTEALPRKPQGGSGWKIFLDVDNDASTGDVFVKGVGVDLYLVVEYDADRNAWKPVVVRRVPELETVPVTLRQVRVRKKEVKLEVQSPVFIGKERWRFFIEAWDGRACADRMPNEGSLEFPPRESAE